MRTSHFFFRYRLGYAVSAAFHLALFGAISFKLLSVPRVPVGSNKGGDSIFVEIGASEALPKVKAVVKPTEVADSDVVVKAVKPAERSGDASTISSSFGEAGGSDSGAQIGKRDGVEVNLRERYLYELRTFIENRKRYPPAARKFGEQGKAIVRFNVDRDGSISEATLVSATRSDRLNEAAIKLIAFLPKFKPLPDEVRDQNLTLEVPIDYVLQ